MRKIVTLMLALGAVTAIGACSDAAMPSGRWQGAAETGQVMIVARLEISPHGDIRVSAPNAILDLTALPKAERAAMRAHLEAELAAAWPGVAPRRMDFDGKVFRNPGGFAPQMEWDAGTRQMTLIVYPANLPSVRIAMEAVEAFP